MLRAWPLVHNASGSMIEFTRNENELIARTLLGEPNKALSRRHELRFGTHGSLSVDLVKGQWFDHESQEGGSALTLIRREKAYDNKQAFEWLEQQGIKARHPKPNGADIEYDAAADPFKGATFKKENRQFRIVKTWAYVDENGEELFEVCRLENGETGVDGKPAKTYRQRHKTPGGYHNSVNGIRQVPYKLPELVEAVARNEIIFVTEGEKCADAVIELGGVATCNAMGAGKWPDELVPWFKGADVIILPDNDGPGRKHAALVRNKLLGTTERTRVLELHGLQPKGDVADWIEAGGTLQQLYELVETNCSESTSGGEPSTDSALEVEIKRLASLSEAAYERERKAAAKTLDIRASVLDRLVAAEKDEEEPEPGSGRKLELPSPEPWPEAIDGPALVEEIAKAIRKYVVLTEQDALALALWVLHSYCFNVFPCTPRLAITSPEKRCGKTTLLDVIGLLVPRPLSTANISAAATFRTIETARPILLIDEADTFLGENEELRGILNSGHRAGEQVVRTVGDNFEVRAFSTHCPVAIAQIGKLPDTLADRSVHISMKRRAPGETVSRFRHGRTPELIEAASKAARWTADNSEAIRECDPVIPDAIFNRAADNWAPLLAIAEVIGGDIVALARQAALAACGVEEELSHRAALLADIREVFAENGSDRISSFDLVAALVAMADKPWGECNHGKALTQNGLARRLKGFGIFPEKIGPKTKRVNGYSKVAFADAFSRYLPNPPFQSGHPGHPNEINEIGEIHSGHHGKQCPDENCANPLNLNECPVCPDENPEPGVHDENAAIGTSSGLLETATPAPVDSWGLDDL
jgi:Protein of unknown function (DUF3631)